jgi:hypothetical protein
VHRRVVLPTLHDPSIDAMLQHFNDRLRPIFSPPRLAKTLNEQEIGTSLARALPDPAAIGGIRIQISSHQHLP